METPFYSAFPLDENAQNAIADLQKYITVDEHPTATVIEEDCAIIVLPGRTQLAQLETVLRNDYPQTVQENALYYEQVAKNLQSFGVAVIHIDTDYLKLVDLQRTFTLRLRGENLPPWNLIFFKKGKEPMIIPNAMFYTRLVCDYFDLRDRY